MTMPALDFPATAPFNYANELPADPDQPWPHPMWDPVHADYRVWGAWWSGDPDELMEAYWANGGNSPQGRAFFATTGEKGINSGRMAGRGGLRGRLRRWFWGELTSPGEKRTNYHVPLASDIAGASSALMFAQPPTLKDPAADTDTQEWLESACDDGLHAKLLEGAEACAAYGGVYLRTVWDTEISGSAWIDAVPPDMAIPEFRHGRLASVTFWSELASEGDMVVRHLEKHIPSQGVILHGVYEGDGDTIGRQIDLGAFPQTRPIAQVAPDGIIQLPNLPNGASTVVYIPNIRPNRIWRQLGPQITPLGRSDYSSLEGQFDALDEAFSSWMRDIRLGKARLIVPHTYLDSIGKGKGAVFSPEREIFSPLNMLVTGEASGGTGITPQQFNIRWESHAQTCQKIIEQAVTQAGYSGQTLGLSGDMAQTATEVIARERKSITTRGRKVLYWRPAMQDILFGLMSVNQSVFGSRIEPVRPDIEFPAAVHPDPQDLAQTVATLRGAEAASVETAVATAHPTWDTGKVAEEVQRIYAETGLDAAARARVTLSAAPNGPSVGEQLAGLPSELGGTFNPDQVDGVAAATTDDSTE